MTPMRWTMKPARGNFLTRYVFSRDGVERFELTPLRGSSMPEQETLRILHALNDADTP